MKAIHILMVMVFSIGMGLGQLLLKLSAKRQSINVDSPLTARLIFLLGDWAFLMGVALYGLLLVYWVWLLTFLPLSRAYPFTILSLVVAAVGGAVFFQESLSISFIAGLTIIGIGLAVLSIG